VADIEFHPEAQAEYEEALAWYEARSPRAATGFEAEVEKLLKLIERSPEMFPRYDDEHRYAVLRRYPYSIVYQIESDRSYVVAVPHAKRRPGYWHGRY
jgi:plasmid stabilization system protein ParE